MTGKQLFEKYQAEAKTTGPGTEQSYYAGILFQSIIMVGEEKTYDLLVQAEKEGKKLDLSFPIKATEGPSEPSGVILVPKE